MSAVAVGRFVAAGDRTVSSAAVVAAAATFASPARAPIHAPASAVQGFVSEQKILLEFHRLLGIEFLTSQ